MNEVHFIKSKSAIMFIYIANLCKQREDRFKNIILVDNIIFF